MNAKYLYLLACYILGSFPMGHITAMISGKGKIFTKEHKRNPDLNMVFEILGLELTIIITLLDILKGFIAVSFLFKYFHTHYGIESSWQLLSLGAIMVVIGHSHSIFLGFKGGRGLATIFGVILYLFPLPSIICFILWAIISFWGLSTIPGALSATGLLPIISSLWIYFKQPDKINFLYMIAALSIWSFWENREGLLNYMGISKFQKALQERNNVKK